LRRGLSIVRTSWPVFIAHYTQSEFQNYRILVVQDALLLAPAGALAQVRVSMLRDPRSDWNLD